MSSGSWRQATLPVGLGGLGIRRTEEVALPTFQASLHSVQQLVLIILPEADLHGEANLALSKWSLLSTAEPPVPELRRQKKAWDMPLLKEIHEELRCRSHVCRCGASVDEFGQHGLSCKFSGGRHSRHSAFNESLKRALTTAQIPAVLEPPGIFRKDKRRPDGITQVSRKNGKELVWDVTVVDTQALTNLAMSTAKAGSAADAAEKRNITKYGDIGSQFEFCPVGLETLGPWGPSATALFEAVGRKMAEVTGEPRAGSYPKEHFLMWRLRFPSGRQRVAVTVTQRRRSSAASKPPPAVVTAGQTHKNSASFKGPNAASTAERGPGSDVDFKKISSRSLKSHSCLKFHKDKKMFDRDKIRRRPVDGLETDVELAAP
ncbi:hypothetical protein RvY_19016 [Ramazzottius varieornatus]|uniref:Uncharacterized protein n=1 Tax=Ramazzottius varieornatus TaxID=947166 RepID=A0A1D1W7W2_RAMVA|nr:hypothetical protein RvY_19016 [Ramazzottius varieornatus]